MTQTKICISRTYTASQCFYTFPKIHQFIVLPLEAEILGSFGGLYKPLSMPIDARAGFE
jgi:hypothetical protein